MISGSYEQAEIVFCACVLVTSTVFSSRGNGLSKLLDVLKVTRGLFPTVTENCFSIQMDLADKE